MEKDIGARQELDRAIAELAFAVNKPSCLEAFTALAEWMEAHGHTPREIAGTFRECLRPKVRMRFDHKTQTMVSVHNETFPQEALDSLSRGIELSEQRTNQVPEAVRPVDVEMEREKDKKQESKSARKMTDHNLTTPFGAVGKQKLKSELPP